ncbi:acyl-CoA dehydrogenase family protein [Sphingomicrobium lutaoense]|uniref:3-methylmercaptopropionyl-CoA dehydrogenase n=1 Tax=Sphingomicrobium lutaoense TaxID=515949 RepID=A0A839YW94_9SPHN|nr:acyl-CoA dehydrogenase family protein [Sphingomicrobium lutaoense]MBB3763469.1 alkylation response protein AidB-like acyl-CoA dehydrogenase [Sphingomicrobium lutaoense]
MPFTVPVADQARLLEHVVGIEGLAQHERFAHADPETVEAVLEGAASFAEGEFLPLHRIGDEVGAKLEDGVVTMPPGYREAYRAFVDAGWMTLSAPTDFGGQAMPLALSAALMENLNATNIGFALCPMLSLGAVEALEAHGSDELKARYLDKIVSGEWPATMNLTEPQAGSDVGALTSKAEPAGDGSWRISGQKIYITYGEHDLADNIIHLVLARTPGAPEGTRGISLFLVPKILPDGSRNDLVCTGLEEKLGIHASPTCVMRYGENGGATGWMVGPENGGMRAMFTMMNNARLNVGLQGVGLAERATQEAVAYALDRTQGMRGGRPTAIAEHPDVRRMLMRMRALTMGARALCYYAFGCIDKGETGDTEAALRAEVLIPMAKAWSTDVGVEVASLGIQVHGGMGYIEETGAAQHLRDARIAPIYEGTNGIQAADLVGRKLGLDGGLAFDGLIADVHADTQDERLMALADVIEQTATMLREAAPDHKLAGSYPFLDMCSVMVAAWLLEKVAIATDDPRTKAASEYFLSVLVPEALGKGAAASAGAEILYSVPAETLA